MKKIVIIGASSGIGLQVAADFARMGWRVGMGARRTAPMEEIKALYPGSVAVKSIDVTAPDAPKRLAELIELIDGMDVLLYASGVGFRDTMLDDSVITNTLEVNVVGFARIVAEAYKYYRRTASAERGQIAVITSVAGTNALGPAAAYSASKRFQQQFLDSLRQLAIHQRVNVDITDIRPGFVRTALLDPKASYPMLMSVAQVAPLIEKAILKRRAVVTVDSRWRIVNALWRLIPDFIWRRCYIGLSEPEPAPDSK